MRRGTIEILRDILAIGKCSTNEAIYKVGLNPPQFGRYRALLLQGGFIKAVLPRDGRRFKLYEPTPQGVELCKRIDQVLELLPQRQSTLVSSPHLYDSERTPATSHVSSERRESSFIGRGATTISQPQGGNGSGG